MDRCKGSTLEPKGNTSCMSQMTFECLVRMGGAGQKTKITDFRNSWYDIYFRLRTVRVTLGLNIYRPFNNENTPTTKKERCLTNGMTFSARSRGNDSRAFILRRGSVFAHEGKNEGNRSPRVDHLLYWGTSCMYRRDIFTFFSREWLLQQYSSCGVVLCFLRHLYLFCRSNGSCFRRAFLQ